MDKKLREAVYKKYDGHCAYCGKKIAYKEMQVDHFVPVRNGGETKIENLMPACRMCNHYKRAYSLENFRKAIQEIPRKLKREYIYKIGVAFGNVIEDEKPIVFYFERR